MAASYNSLPTIYISITILLLVLIFQTQQTLSTDIEDGEVYVLDNPNPNFRPRSRFLASNIIKKGMSCNSTTNNICNGVSANNGTSLLNCCKKHCRNTLGDENNCGSCGIKCRFAELCCNGECVKAAFDSSNCGECNHKCAQGVACNLGYCGYA